MFRFRAAAATAAAMIALAPSAGVAQNARGYYAAAPAAAPSKSSVVTRSTVWKCTGGSCVAAKGNARDAIMCELLAREVGALTAFRAGDTEFDAEALAKCNSKAR